MAELTPFSRQSTTAGGTAFTAPGAGVAFVTLPITTQGIYEINGWVALTGTTETGLNNISLAVGSITAIVPSLTGLVIPIYIPRVYIAGGATSAILRANGAGTAGANYAGFLTATRVG